jgi:hypothetical protein
VHLEKALQSFGPNGEYWAKGEGTVPPAPFLCVYSALDAVVFAPRSERLDSQGYLRVVTGLHALSIWNDAVGTTWTDIKVAFEKAIELAKRDEQNVHI